MDGLSLLDAIDDDPTAAWMNQLPQVTFLRTLWDQHFQRTTVRDVAMDADPVAEPRNEILRARKTSRI
jgi:hypothetical protein